MAQGIYGYNTGRNNRITGTCTVHASLSLTHTHTHTHFITAAVTLSYSFTLQAVSRQLLECPDLKYAEIATIGAPTTKYQASQSGLSD